MTDGTQRTGLEARRVIEALAAHEDAVGDLYAAYAVRFPKAASFWQGLSTEEYGHGSLMRDLGAHEHELDVFVDTRRFPLPELQAATRAVRDQIAVAEGSHVTLVEALENALDLEQEIVEREAYEVFSSDSPNVSRVLGHLRTSSEQHRDGIREFLTRAAR
jgi:hypothetical protein